jgi:hypothetical protein
MHDFGEMVKDKKHVLRKTFERNGRNGSSTINKDDFSQSVRETLGALTKANLEILEKVMQIIFFSSGAIRPLWVDYDHFILTLP